jgi:phage N-6-adenine-methyltransferase
MVVAEFPAMTMPAQKPGQSEQCVGTPWEFINAVDDRFGQFSWDLAASPVNAKCETYFTEEHNSLIQYWHKIQGNLWLNPPFGDIEPWAAKCCAESKLGANIFMLVPASVGSNWYKDYVHNRAYVLALSPRVKFVGHAHAYPKDLMLVIYNAWGLVGFDTWRWKP